MKFAIRCAHPARSLRSIWTLVPALAVAAACGKGSQQVALEPVAELAPAPRELTLPVVSVVEDSVADDVALQAIKDLEYGSLAKGADHVRGTVPQPDSQELQRLFIDLVPGSRGGAASAVGPTYDFDVESFATHRRVEYYMEYYLGKARERFGIWLGRLNRYEGMIRERFRAYGVPEDMVYLALIESGYSNTAVSRSRAVGMWQFMSGTASRYGLKVDSWVDERRDPFKATEAAARYLADHNELFGSWYLAAAAYNGGGGRVTRGLRRLSRQGVSTEGDTTFFRLSDRRYLKRETRDYVPKLIAATIIAKDPARYGFSNVPRQVPFVFDEITVPDRTGLDVIAKLADTTYRAITELNPQYYRGVTPAHNSIVRVPRGVGSRVIERYAVLPPSERVNFITHSIRRGETLSGLGQRYGVSVRLIRAANPNVHPRRLRVGGRLVIPLSAAAKARHSASRTTSPATTASGSRYHTVRRGESLWAISRRYGVTINQLRTWNGMKKGEVLRTGKRLVVGQ